MQFLKHQLNGQRFETGLNILKIHRRRLDSVDIYKLHQHHLKMELDMEVIRRTEATPSGHAISDATLRKNRAIMTILHFMLTYPKFSFSLFVLFASFTTPLPTSKEKVWGPISNLRTIVQTEASLYHECVADGFARQDVQMDRAAEKEQKRVYEYHIHHLQPIIESASHSTSLCFNATLSAQLALRSWNAKGQEVPRSLNISNMNSALCSVEDQKQLEKMLSQEQLALFNNVQSIIDSYLAASLASVGKLVRYTQDRSLYDYNYFIGVKVPAIFATLDMFASPNVYLTFPEQRMLLELRGILNGMVDALNLAYGRIDVLSIRLVEFEASIKAFHFHYTDLYGRLELIQLFVRDFFPTGMVLPDYFNISGVPLPDLLLPPTFSIPNFNGELPMVNDLVSEYIVKAIALLTRLLQEAAEEASEQARKAMEELIAILKELLTLEDYDPPTYPTSQGISTPNDELVYLENLASETKEDASKALDELKLRANGLPEYKPVTPNVDVVPPTLDEQNQKFFAFLDLRYPAFVIPLWILVAVGYLSSRSFLIECLMQAIRLYRLKKKYEKKASPDLPEIDFIGSDDDQKPDGEAQPSRMQVAQVALLRNMMNPWVLLGLLLIPSVIAVLIIWFPHVKHNCIESRRGTFLARNMLTQLQVNKANSQGYALYAVAQTDCTLRRLSICNTMSTKADAAYRNNMAALYSLHTSLNNSNTMRGVMKRCVDTDTLDERFQTDCCGLEGYATKDCSRQQQWQLCPIDDRPTPPASFSPVGAYLLESACDLDVFESSASNDALFNCSVLEDTCNAIPCTGVDADFIESMTIEADCMVEIYAIQLGIFFALAVYHAVMINFGNTLVFNGILRVRWKSLKPEGFKMITHVDYNGELVKGNDRQERSDRVGKAVRMYVLIGYTQIVLGSVVFLAWLISLLVLRKASSRLNVYHA